MPKAEEIKRGGAVRYRTIKRGSKTFRVTVVPVAGPRGGHTIVQEIKPKRRRAVKAMRRRRRGVS